jgi:SAM-dependent methyltransferase
MRPTERFSSRVDDYRRYRPGYPAGIISTLTRARILNPESVVADIGSGTGLLTRPFLENGNTVFGIEPNPDMRAAGEAELASFSKFRRIAATAENTTLHRNSIDLIIAGQAFHWFDRAAARIEFRRILHPLGRCAFIWNERTVNTPFLVAYEELLRKYSTDYSAVDHRNITPQVIQDFFAPNPVTLHTFENQQVFNLEALRGRLLSSSYAPASDHPNHAPMLTMLEKIFHQHQSNGMVHFNYETRMYLSTLSG